jgi:hypothetical protein
MKLLREHGQRVRAELEQLTENLSIIESKANIYARHVDATDISQLWTDQTPACLALEAQAARSC